MMARLRGQDDGSVSLLFVVLAVGLPAMVGLVVDGGGKARAAGVTGRVRVTPGGREPVATTTDTYTPLLLSAIEVGPFNVTGAATAELVTLKGAP